MTGFHQYALVGLTQRSHTMYAEMNAACSSTRNEATVHVLLNILV